MLEANIDASFSNEFRMGKNTVDEIISSLNLLLTLIAKVF